MPYSEYLYQHRLHFLTIEEFQELSKNIRNTDIEKIKLFIRNQVNKKKIEINNLRDLIKRINNRDILDDPCANPYACQGGGYYEKYLKYKQKYLQLKNNI